MMGRNMRRPRGRQAGFTLIEILIVVAVIAVMAAIAIPNLLQARIRARASAIVADYYSVQQAALSYYLDRNEFPPDKLPCQEPLELRPYIGASLRWESQGDHCYDWENWVRPDGTPMHPQTGIAIGFSVVTQDQRLVEALRKVSLLELRRTVGNNYTFVIEGI